MGFFEEYFLQPILQNGWFNPVNTITYALVLVVAVFLVFKLLSRMGIQINKNFFYAVLPFIFWGSSTRVLHDAALVGALSPGLNAFYSSSIFPTPGSYFITFTLAILVLLISLGIHRLAKVPYWKPMIVIGTALTLLNLSFYPWSTAAVLPFLLVVGLVLLWMGLVFGLSRLFRLRFFQKRHIHLDRGFSRNNQVILGAHFLDASATFVSLSLFSYLEQHVLPRFLFELFGPISMFALKLVVVLLVLWIIDTYSDDRKFNNFLKIVVFILGAAPGIRDLLRLMLGV